MNAVLEAGYGYELAGVVFYVFFLAMLRKRAGFQYAQHTRVLTIITAIALVGVVPFHYGHNPTAIGCVLLLGLASLASAFIDARAKP